MSRKGTIDASTRQPGVLRVTCKHTTLILIGCTDRMAGRFEHYAHAELPAPIEIDKIQKIEWINFDSSDVKALDTVFENITLDLTEDPESA